MDEKRKKIRFFTDLDAWKQGHRLVLNIYELIKLFPKEELFGLSTQMRRSAISITSNIAEGFSRESYKDKVRFYFIAKGSLTELQNQLIIARDVGYFEENEYENIYNQSVSVHKILSGLIKKSKLQYS